MRRLLAMLLTGLALPATATAQDQEPPDPDEFTPVGYTFCGWKDFTEPVDQLSWTTEWDDSLSGAYLVGFARRMTCLQATRNIDLVRYSRKGRPYRTGYRCTRIQSGHEFDDVRCIKRGKKATFRYQTGA